MYVSICIPVKMVLVYYVCACWVDMTHLEQGVVFEKSADNFTGLFCSQFQNSGDLDNDCGFFWCTLSELENQTYRD